jgi:hypothetical protein
MKPSPRSMPVAEPVLTDCPALPLNLTVIEMEVDVDRARLIAAEEPDGAALPAVVVRMPAYVAGALAKVLDTWAIVCQAAGSDDTTEWVTAAHALLLAGREAADGIPYPELADLLHAIPDTLTTAAREPAPVPAPAPAPDDAEPAVAVTRPDDHRVAGRPVGQRTPAGAEPVTTGRRGDARHVARVPAGSRAAAGVSEARAAAGPVEGRRVGGRAASHPAADVARSPVAGTLVDGRRSGDECA